MKITFNYILSLLVAGVMCSSCLPDEAEDALKYDGPTLVEFKNHTLGMVAESYNAASGLDFRGVLAGSGNAQTDSSRVISLLGATIAASGTTPARTINARTVDTVLVQLVGPHRSTPTEVAYQVISETGTTAAVQGTHYTIEPADGVVTIPANSSFGYIYIRGNAASFTGTERRRVGLRLVGAPDAAANPNYDSFYVTMTRTR